MSLKISVIIPTYHRPDYLLETLQSVFSQTLLPDEILIGDDSKNNLTKLLINSLLKDSPVPIRYFHHNPSLKEVANVDFLFAHATGELALLLHDDDPIYPHCLEVLKKPFGLYPEITASFGLQRMIDEKGALTANPEAVNEDYFRTAQRAGLVDGLFAGTVSMFPNNAYLIKRDIALSLGYSDSGRAGKAVDFYFGFRLGKLGNPFYFVNEYTAKCRVLPDSQSRTNDADNDYRSVRILLEDCDDIAAIPELDNIIRSRIPRAITTAAKIKDRKNAIKWLTSTYYRSRLLTPRGIKRILQVLNPF
ncbi:glycosyltransferase family 2 protein [Mucilaginibacter sp. HD30]